MRQPIRVAGIVLNKNQVLLMHRIKDGKEYYVFPGGGVENNETDEEALIREIKEEASIRIKIGKMLYTHNYETSSQHYYLCTYISGKPKLREDSIEIKRSQKGNDIYEPMWIDIGKLLTLLLYPLEIRDWLIEDLNDNFAHTPKVASLKVSELRQTL